MNQHHQYREPINSKPKIPKRHDSKADIKKLHGFYIENILVKKCIILLEDNLSNLSIEPKLSASRIRPFQTEVNKIMS